MFLLAKDNLTEETLHCLGAAAASSPSSSRGVPADALADLTDRTGAIAGPLQWIDKEGWVFRENVCAGQIMPGLPPNAARSEALHYMLGRAPWSGTSAVCASHAACSRQLKNVSINSAAPKLGRWLLKGLGVAGESHRDKRKCPV